MVAALVMMERGRNLNDPLKEGTLRFRSGQPDLLPCLVGLKEVPTVELFHSFPEPCFFFFVIAHFLCRGFERAQKPGIIADFAEVRVACRLRSKSPA